MKTAKEVEQILKNAIWFTVGFCLVAVLLFAVGWDFAPLVTVLVLVPFASIGAIMAIVQASTTARYKRLYLETLKNPEKLLQSIAKRSLDHESGPAFETAKELVERCGMGPYHGDTIDRLSERHETGLFQLEHRGWLVESDCTEPMEEWSRGVWEDVLRDNPMPDDWTPPQPTPKEPVPDEIITHYSGKVTVYHDS